MVNDPFSWEYFLRRSARNIQLRAYPRIQPGKNHKAESPSLYARPTVPSTAQALSELAVEEMAVTQALRDRLARKKPAGEWVAWDAE